MSTYGFSQRARDSVTFSWQDRLEAATSEAQVVDVVRDYLAAFTPVEISSLPLDCSPGKFFEADDVTSYAFALARHNCGEEDETAATIHKIANFFSNASTRLSQIMARANTYEANRRRSV